MTEEILALQVADEGDLVASRHVVREIAAAVGLAPPDQVRLATALSEVIHDLLSSGGGRVALSLEEPTRLRVSVETAAGGDDGGLVGDSPGIDAARRLLDSVEVAAGDDGAVSVTLDKHIDNPAQRDVEELRALGRQLVQSRRTPADELRAQNRELVLALDEIRVHYDELETTNQGVVALYAELDERSRLLREASESKSRFLQNISHELRTPGNSVLGLARLLLDPRAETLSDEQRQQVEFIQSSAEDLLRLVNQLLDLAKAESGAIEPVVEPVDLVAVFEELNGTIGPLVTRAAVTLDVRRPVGAEELSTDPILLRHVLRNLLSNAVKFTERGSVTMTAEVEDEMVLVSVRDTGVGIAEVDQPRVFEEFFQVRGPLQTQAKGSGLGLPFARRLAILLGGDLRLDSVPGQGTTFTLSLPLVPLPAAPPTTPTPRGAAL